MKRWTHVLWLGLLLGSEATASAFWCNGDDRFSDHPLDFDVTGESLRDLSSLPELYQTIRGQFVDHVNKIDERDEKNVQILLGMFDDLLNPASSSFLRHTQFRWRDAELRGIDMLDCDRMPEDVLNQQPGLSAVYGAIETTRLAGRRANLRDIEKDAEVIRKNWKETNAWLLEDGLPQWPWEMWLNEKLLDTDPGSPTPKSQYLFIRPSLGLNLSYPQQEDADVVPTGALEIFGKIWYRDSYKKHWGLALLTDIDTDNGAGIGLSVRWNGYWAGFVDHAEDRPAALYIGVDLYDLLQNDEERRAQVNDFVDELSPSVKGLPFGAN